RDVLIDALDFENAKPFLREGATAQDWAEYQHGPTTVGMNARDYYKFALGKIENHRGISASRSVQKLTEYAWLLGLDHLAAHLEEMTEGGGYANYGAPIVRLLGEALGLAWPDSEVMRRMAQGLPCTDECLEGCSR